MTSMVTSNNLRRMVASDHLHHAIGIEIDVAFSLQDIQSSKENSELGGEFVDILNGTRRIVILELPFRRSDSVVRCWNGRRHHEFLEA